MEARDMSAYSQMKEPNSANIKKNAASLLNSDSVTEGVKI